MRPLRPLVPVLLTIAVGCSSGGSVSPEIDPARVANPPRNAITYWGHATGYIDIDGFGIVADPRAGKFNDQTSVILISRAYNSQELKPFSRDVVVLCPEPATDGIEALGFEVLPMAPGDEYVFPGGTISAVRAQAPGDGSAAEAAEGGDALGYVVHARGRSIYYAGDSGYFHGMYSIRREHHPDIVLLKLGDHLSSYDAMFAISALGNPTVIPFEQDAGSDSPSDLLAELIGFKGDLIVPISEGESFAIEEREAGVAPLTPVP